MKPPNKSTLLWIAFDLVVHYITELYSEELESCDYSDEKVAYRIELEMRRIGFSFKAAKQFAEAINEENQYKITRRKEKMYRLYDMAMTWLEQSHTLLVEEVIDEIRDDVFSMCHPCEESRIFIRELVSRISTRLANKSIRESPPQSSYEN